MTKTPAWRRYLTFWRSPVPQDVDDELRFHTNMRIREYMSRGMCESEAKQAVAERLGDVASAKSECVQLGHARARNARNAALLDALVGDLRYAIRGLRARPGFSASIIMTLGLGVGANATMFGIIDRLLFRTPTFLIAPERTGRVYVSRLTNGTDVADSHMGYKRFVDLRTATQSFDVMAPFFAFKLPVGTGESTRQMDVGMTTADLWALFLAKPVIGRFFDASADTPPNGEKVVVLSYAFWQTQFGGRKDVLGSPIDIGPDRYTVIGVAPAGFDAFSRTPLVGIIPVAAAASAFAPNRSWHLTYSSQWLQEVFVRRKIGITPAAADADLTLALARSWEAQRAEGRWSLRLPPITIAKPHAFAGPVLADRGPNESSEAKVATWLGGVALIVLLIACANVANLLLARAFARRREIAVRLALGITRSRLLAQLMIESIVLAVAGTTVGVVFAQWGGATVGAQLLTNVHLPSALTDSRMLAYCALVAICTGLITGAAPAMHARRADITTALKTGGRDGTMRRSRVQLGLLFLQAALSVVLLVGAGLFLRSLANVKSLRLGYDADRLIWVDVDNRGVPLDSAQEVALRTMLLERVKTLPGVTAAARGLSIPFFQAHYTYLHVDGLDSLSKLGRFSLQVGTPELFQTMGTRIVRGRGFTADDRNRSPRSMVVSAAMAKRIWPAEDPIGKCMHVSADTTPCFTIVGVAEDIHQTTFAEPALHYYVPFDHMEPNYNHGGLFVRTEGATAVQAERVRQELQRSMPGASYVTATPLAIIVGDKARSWKLGASLFTAFGGLALLIAAVGLYSVIAYGVTQRMHEMGVRVAMGARSPDLVRLIVGEGVRVVVPGVCLGVVVALVAGRRIAPLLFKVSPTDPEIVGTVVAVLLVTAFLASLVPAARAAHADPNDALRD
jgi:putative ABC transport system permease protein